MNLEVVITNAKRPQNNSLLIMTVNKGIQSCIFFLWHVSNKQNTCDLNVYPKLTFIFNSYDNN